MSKTLDQIKAIYAEMPMRRRITIGACAALTIGLLSSVGWYGSRPALLPLYPSLGPEDSDTILSALRQKGVLHEVNTGKDDKMMIMVPRESVAALRMEFAEQGIPSASVVEGWSIVDNEGFGISESKHRLNRLRAQQGELARTISENKNIIGARVHLAVPDARTLRLHRDKPSASVALKLRPGKSLDKAQVRGIAYLVAQSVVGLEASMVSIVDDQGRLLHKPRQGDADLDGVEEKKNKLEREVEANLIRVFESVIGPNRVIANVSVEIDRSRVEQTEENFDPDAVAVRSEQKSKDTRGEQSKSTAAVPGVQANTPEPPVAEGPTRSSSADRLTDVTNYEVSKTVRKTSIPAGAIRRMSVAVIVDGNYSGEAEKRTYTPRDKAEIARLTQLAQTVAGFDLKRGDTVNVVQSPFSDVMASEIASLENAQRDWVELTRPYWGWALLCLVTIVALLIFGRPTSALMQELVVRVRDANPAGQLAHGEAPALALAAPGGAAGRLAGDPSVQNVQLPAGFTEEQAAATAESLGVSREQAIAIAAQVQQLAEPPAPPAPPSMDLKLHDVLEEVGNEDDEDWDDNMKMTQRAARLEGALREVATTSPEALAEALTFWMNDRHV